ncbi:Pentatricopeptide repeat [Cocos nucifera]|uniref:Pentatricopeptide repeat n=1 Tax=Cocos nucifera TaxID=13894 RepID=A0A8K0I7M5_COCNU|nr:Pentatricopeptide repeat [Cocos nucifera]
MPPPRPLTNLFFHHFRPLCTSTSTITSSPSPIDPARLLRLCTVLYQQQDAPDPRFHSHLQKLHLSPSHELFLQVCNRFPCSWKPVHRFHLFLLHSHSFSHSPVTANKLLDVLAKARNIRLLWSFLHDILAARLFTPRTLRLAARSLAEAREIKKCAELFHLIHSYNYHSLYNVDTLNQVVETLCAGRLVDVAKAVVAKLTPFIAPDDATYRFLVVGFCKAGDLVEASKLWNKMVGVGLEPDVESCEEIVATLFKNNRFEDAMRMFKSMRYRRFADLGLPSYRAVIAWMCKEGRILNAHMLFGEMVKRGVGVEDNATLGALVYGLLVRGRIREGYRVFEGVREPDISLYHGLIKGLLRLRKAAEATEVFREMIKRGVEPIMHTYIMLLQGHLGKRGRKGRDPLVNFESIFVGGLVKVGRTLEATKFVERMMGGGVEVPRFDYNKFLHWFSNEEGVTMFEKVGKRLRDVGLVDLGDIFLRYGERMATRDRRRRAMNGLIEA